MTLRWDKGFTLIELMLVVVILGLLASFAGPSISDYIDKRKIINAAEAVYSQLQFARGQAISRSKTVHVNFDYQDAAVPASWLMGVSTNNDCDPNLVAGDADWTHSCILVVSDGDADKDTGDGTVDTDDLVFYVTSGVGFNGVVIDADGSGTGGAPNQISFDPTRGTAGNTNETIHLTFNKGDSSYEMRVVVAPIGRVKVCTPVTVDGTKSGTKTGKAVPGYSACPA